MNTTNTPETDKQADIQIFVDNLDERGLLVLQVLMGQRAIALIEAKDKAKKAGAILKPRTLVYS